MSSLAAARADGYYRAKNFDPAKFAPRKSDTPEDKPFTVVQGQRVGGFKTRYETPFHVRCDGCHNMIAKGVRFNSIQTWVGNFHTTKIYQFRMKCPQCIQRLVVRTDPQNCAKRIFQVKDCTDETRIRDQEAQKKIKENPLAKLQNQYEDKLAYGGLQENLQQLLQIQQRGSQDFQLNRLLRKKARFHREEEQDYYRYKMQKNISIPLLPAIEEDEQKADMVQFKINKKKQIKKEQKIVTEVDRLKDKMRKMKPEFRNMLQKEIRVMNKPSSSMYIKK